MKKLASLALALAVVLSLCASTPYDMTFLVSCCNGREGYIPSQAAFDYGCYESYTTQFAPGTGEEFIDEFLSMLTELKNG